MTLLTVRKSSIKDALGKLRKGWMVFENGRPSYPYESKEQAIRAAEAIKSIRCSNTPVKIIDEPNQTLDV